jgi:hypothetical protein
MKSDGSTLAIGAAALLAAAGALVRSRGSQATLKERIDARLKQIEERPEMPPDPEDTRAYFSAVWGSDLPADAFVTELTTDRGAAETSARRIRASLASLRDRDRTYHGLSERDAFEQRLLLAELDGLERRFGDSIGKAPVKSPAHRAYRSSYERDGEGDG